MISYTHMESILIGIVILLFSAILHEIAHGYVADKLGDPTARIAGRLTLNPLPHIDPLMSIFVPFLLILSGSPIIFGAAKPVPVNPLMLKDGRKDLALVALAGPLTNILLALIAAIIFRLLFPSISLYEVAIMSQNGLITLSSIPNIAAFSLAVIALINLTLGFLNLIPIPPLDGSKFFSIILPDRIAQQYFSFAPFGIFLLFGFLLLTPLGDVLQSFIYTTLNILSDF